PLVEGLDAKHLQEVESAPSPRTGVFSPGCIQPELYAALENWGRTHFPPRRTGSDLGIGPRACGRDPRPLARLGRNLQGFREETGGDDSARGEKKWRRRESNPRPEAFDPETLRA